MTAMRQVDPLLRCLGKAWSLEILRILKDKEDDTTTPIKGLLFNELIYGLDGIRAKVLSERLDELENLGVVRRSIIPDKKPQRVMYSLLEKGDKVVYHVEKLMRIHHGQT